MNQTSSSQRLYSPDAPCGFDLFRIMGAGGIVRSLAKAMGFTVLRNKFKLVLKILK